MKPTAILINTCRGPVVDEKALYNALRDEKILGAGLDVMVEEPPKPDHELFTLKNAIFSPHGAGPTWDNHWKRWRNAFDNFERVARGRSRSGSSPNCATSGPNLSPDAHPFSVMPAKAVVSARPGAPL